jgi:hypothetical protein
MEYVQLLQGFVRSYAHTKGDLINPGVTFGILGNVVSNT